ncbi:MAG: hypothetical protein JNJ89_13335 [Rubrivivax sp.]|nr:hypothetical protein [Rubrivivax sp.]
MPRLPKLPALASVALLALAGAAAHAESFASSAISNSVSTSVGSVSTSFNASSDASSPGRPVAAGAWRVVEVAAAPGREGIARVALRAESGRASDDGAREATLFLPQETVARAGVAAGQVIHARERSYGLELALGSTAETAERAAAFFLVVADDVYRELQTRPVRL